MTLTGARIAPCLWFASEAEEAARYYTSIFPGSSIRRITHYGREGFEIHGQPEGTVLTVDFVLDGHPFTALNGGPAFRFNEAVSLQVICSTQEEVDHYWERLSQGGDPAAQQCGWLKDRYGLSWQVVPVQVQELLDSPDPDRRDRVMNALLKMKKLEIAGLEAASEGVTTDEGGAGS
jgi:predicted 3-demethylubiquinone-9 3-methyltransferase (glyoxalase superfamily)